MATPPSRRPSTRAERPASRPTSCCWASPLPSCATSCCGAVAPGRRITIVTESFYHIVFLLLLFTLFRGPLQAFVTTLVQYSAALVVALAATDPAATPAKRLASLLPASGSTQRCVEVRLLYITAGYPFGGTAESFLEPDWRPWPPSACRSMSSRYAGAEPPDDAAPVSGCDPRRSAARGEASSRRRGARGLVGLLPMLRRSPRVLPRNAVILPLATAVAAAASDEGGYDHVHAHWLSHTSTCALAVSRLTGTPFSITAHRWDVYVENLFAAQGPSRPPSSVHRARLPERLRGAGRYRRRSAGRPAHGRRDPAAPGVASSIVGRPSRPTEARRGRQPPPGKGQRHLVDAMALAARPGRRRVARRLRRRAAGAELAQQVIDLGLSDRVLLRGERPRAEPHSAYVRGEYDLFVMPSVDLGGGVHEGVPVSIMEAMVAGVDGGHRHRQHA